MKIKFFLLSLISLLLLAAFVLIQSEDYSANTFISQMIPDSTKNSKGENMEEKVLKTEDEWKKELTSEEYHILREKGTERAFTGKFYDHHETGVYKCAACGNELFSSDKKYDSGCGWPSYWTPLAKDKIILKEDRSHGMVRTEVMCAKCGGHLGHVFDDGPEPTGQRYCINSVSLTFEKTGEKK